MINTYSSVTTTKIKIQIIFITAEIPHFSLHSIFLLHFHTLVTILCHGNEFQLCWDITDVKYYISLRYTVCWFDIHVPCKMLTTVKLVNTSITLVTVELSATKFYVFRVSYTCHHIVFCVWLLSFSIMVWEYSLVSHVPAVYSSYCWVVLHCKGTHRLFSYSLVDGDFQIFFLAFINKTAIKIHGRIFVEVVFISLR